MSCAQRMVFKTISPVCQRGLGQDFDADLVQKSDQQNSLSAAGRLDATIETHSQVGFVIRAVCATWPSAKWFRQFEEFLDRGFDSSWTSGDLVWVSWHFQFPVQGAACWIHRRYDGSACGPHWPRTQTALDSKRGFNEDQLHCDFLNLDVGLIIV